MERYLLLPFPRTPDEEKAQTVQLTNSSTPKTLILSVAGRRNQSLRKTPRWWKTLEPKTLRGRLKDCQEWTTLCWGERSIPKLVNSGAKVDMGGRRGHRSPSECRKGAPTWSWGPGGPGRPGCTDCSSRPAPHKRWSSCSGPGVWPGASAALLSSAADACAGCGCPGSGGTKGGVSRSFLAGEPQGLAQAQEQLTVRIFRTSRKRKTSRQFSLGGEQPQGSHPKPSKDVSGPPSY